MVGRAGLEGGRSTSRRQLAYVPFNYPPLYFWVSALATRVLGDGFLPLRLVSLLSSLACGALLYRLVVFETGRRLAGWVAVGLFFATFRHAGAWLDVARADSFHLALVLASILVLRTRATAAGAVVAGLLIALGFLAKQSAAVVAFPIAVYLFAADARRGVAFTIAATVGIAGSVFALDLASGGWFRYYVFELAGRYSAEPGLAARFWTQATSVRCRCACWARCSRCSHRPSRHAPAAASRSRRLAGCCCRHGWCAPIPPPTTTC